MGKKKKRNREEPTEKTKPPKRVKKRIAQDYIANNITQPNYLKIVDCGEKGRGIATCIPIYKGEFVVYYSGTIREQGSVFEDETYIFEVKAGRKVICIDATEEDGSYGRLLNDNHINPNLISKAIWIDGKVYVIFTALRDIEMGEELEYNYGGGPYDWRERNVQATVQGQKDNMDDLEEFVSSQVAGCEEFVTGHVANITKDINEIQKSMKEASRKGEAIENNLKTFRNEISREIITFTTNTAGTVAAVDLRIGKCESEISKIRTILNHQSEVLKNIQDNLPTMDRIEKYIDSVLRAKSDKQEFVRKDTFALGLRNLASRITEENVDESTTEHHEDTDVVQLDEPIKDPLVVTILDSSHEETGRERLLDGTTYHFIEDVPEGPLKDHIEQHYILTSFASSDKLSPLQAAYFRYLMESEPDVGVSSKCAETFIRKGVENNIWSSDWSPAGIKDLPQYFKNRIKNELSKHRKRDSLDQTSLKRKAKMETQKERLAEKLQKKMEGMLHVDEDMPLFSTGFENGDTFMETLMKCGKKVEAFLHRDKHIPVRGTTVLPYELAHIDTTLDTDGVVIEWNDLTGCTLSLTHLQIAPKGVANLKSFYPILRKHVSANDYNPTVRKHLRESVAIQLFYTDGWETWCGFVATNDCTFIPTSDVIRKLSLQAFNHMKRVFEQNMKEMIKSGRAVNTGIKNNLNDLSKMFILPDDRALVMTALKSAMDDTKFEIDGFKKLVVTFRFGEKGQTELPLPFTDRQTVARITVHIGLSLSFNFADRRVSHLFWCREGIQSLVGGRGQLTTALSFMECVNFQSNLDGRLMTLDRRLREVCRYPDQLTFIQFYSDTPHRSPKCRMHPVSGVVTILEDLFNGYRHIKNDAKIYLDEVDNNVEQLGKCVARLEIVTAVPISTQSVKPDKIMNVDKFTNLLTNYPLLVPFIHAEFIETIQHIGRYFVQLLKRHFVISSGTGNSIAAWECYQAELALEKLFWGHPRCYLSNLYSINLGPGVGNPSRSCTDAMGFLCLENSGSCCVDEFTTPPLAIYSKTDCVQKQISKTFGVINIIDAGSRVLGRRIISVLLDDLHDIGNVYGRLEEFQMQLKCSKNPTAKVVSGCSRQQIAELLANAQKAKYPMVITRLFSVLRKHGLDILQILQDGLCDLGLVYFPAVRFYDRQRNEGLYWQWNFGFWIITDVSSAADEIEQKSNSYTALVVWEVEKQKLFHSSTISGKTLPWVRPVLEKLSDLNLSQDDLVSILTFVTCVARLMQGAYVDFSALSKLERAIPLSQNKLRLRQIQSKILIQQFNKFKLWRLHASIPYKIQDSVSITLTRDEPRQRNVTDDTDTNQYIDMHDYAEDEVENNVIMQIPPKHLATETKTRWSPIELNIVGPLKQLCDSLSDRDIYVKYQSECLAMGIPDRPFRAFRLKLHRL